MESHEWVEQQTSCTHATNTTQAQHTIKPTRHDAVAELAHARRQRLAVGHHLLLVLLELGRGCLLERDRQRRDGVVVGAALQALLV